MDPKTAALEGAIEKMAVALESVERRLSLVEAELAGRPRPAAAATGPAGGELAIPDRSSFLRLVTLVGRSLMALGGAYLLRALTDDGTLAPQIGVGLGVLYATTWLVLAHRAGRLARPRSANFHGLTASLIAFPLIWEATLRLSVLSPRFSVLLLATLTVGGLVVGALYDNRLLAWSSTLLGAGVGLGLMFRTHELETFAPFPLVLGALVLWACERRGWKVLRWFGTAAVDLALLLVLVVAATATPPEWLSRGAAVALLASGALLYLGWIATRALVQRHAIGGFEVAQTLVALGLGFGGAIRLASGSGLYPALGAGALVLAAASYGAALFGTERLEHGRAAFLLFSSQGAVLALAGLRLLLPPAPTTIAWGLLGLASAVLAATPRRRILELHAVAFTIANVFVCGVLHASRDGLFAPAARVWTAMTPACLIAIGLAAASYALLLRRPVDDVDRGLAVGARLLFLVVLLSAACATAMSVLAGPLAGAPGASADAGALAALRTGVVGVGAVLLAAAGRWSRSREAAWLVYPVLALGTLKFLIDDLPHGRAATLFLSLVLLGGALLAASRLSRGEAVPPPGS